jgi:hypothetical protein
VTEDTDLYVPAGRLLLTSHGEYSDYRTGGCFVTLEPLYRSKLQELAAKITADEAAEEARVEETHAAWEKIRRESPPDIDVGKAPPSWYNGGDPQELFINAMIRNGWLLAVAYTEFHVGSYGSLELSL